MSPQTAAAFLTVSLTAVSTTIDETEIVVKYFLEEARTYRPPN